jgi:hypothetical protein
MNYQFTKSIGFQIKNSSLQTLLPDFSEKKGQEIFQECSRQFEILIENFENVVFYENSEGEKKRKKRLEIKYQWLKKHAKNEFYENNLHIKTKLKKQKDGRQKEERVKEFTLEDAFFLQEVFENWIAKSREIQEKIKEIVSQPENNQKRESDLALLLKTLFGTDYFFFVRDFVQYAKDKDSDKALRELEISVRNFQPLLEESLFLLSPNQITGMEVARASFNYYTIEKSSKLIEGKTTEKLIKEKEEEKEKPYRKFLLDRAFLQKIGFEKYLEDWEGKNGEKYSAKTAQELSFQELYSALKDFRAKQKSAFNEAMYQEKWKEAEIEKAEEKIESKGKADLSKIEKNKTLSFEDFFAQAGVERKVIKQKSPQEMEQEQKKQLKQFIARKFPLFDAPEDTLWKFAKLTQEIQKLGEEKNHAKQMRNFERVEQISEELRKKRKERGEYFKDWRFSQYYKKYCNDIYKELAMDFGKLKAEIRGLEHEKIEARLLNYWSMILKEENENFLVLIPKEKRRNAKDFLDAKSNGKGEKTICVFNSLTLRALEKMIRKNYPKEISKDAGNIPFETDIQKIECYKNALSGKLQKLDLDLSGFEDKIPEIINKKYETEEDFRIDFEKISYVVQKKSVSEQDLEKIKTDFGAIVSKISCFDLERKITGEKREHTTFWENFWKPENEKDDFPLRLNPEMRIFWRKALKQENSKKQKNRFSKEHFRVAFTITQNAAQKELNTTFADEKDLKVKIEKFNEEVIRDFVQKHEAKESLWYFGIDRGNQELATLGVMKWSKEEYEATLADGKPKKFPKPEFPEIEVWEMKNPKETKEIEIDSQKTKIIVKISDNPSYFMKDKAEMEKYFSKKTVAFIDLTTAKLIKGKIVLDGDTKTYLNLKKVNAKRKLFDVFSKIDERANVEFFEKIEILSWDKKEKCWKNKEFREVFVIKMEEGKKPNYQVLCYFLLKQERIFSKSEMQQILQKYLDALRKDPTFQENTIEQINHLRDAITANMVGIIAFLHEKYPAIINLENLHKDSDIQRHFSSNNENIARRLEWALYRKFQKIGLVPPNLKQTIFLKEGSQNSLNHFGIIHFVKTEKTSGNCPFCEVNVPGPQRNKDKFEEHAYICRNNKEYCGFTTKNPKTPLEKINDSDSVAAYNIAKDHEADVQGFSENTKKETERKYGKRVQRK